MSDGSTVILTCEVKGAPMYSYRSICARGVALLAAMLVASLLVARGRRARRGRSPGRQEEDRRRGGQGVLDPGGRHARAKEAAERLAAANGALPAAQNLVAERRGQVVAAQVVAETARRKLAEAQAAVADAQGRYAAADETRQRGRGPGSREFVSAAYKGSDLQNLNVLMGASGPLDAFERYGYVDRVVATERDAVRATSTRSPRPRRCRTRPPWPARRRRGPARGRRRTRRRQGRAEPGRGRRARTSPHWSPSAPTR